MGLGVIFDNNTVINKTDFTVKIQLKGREIVIAKRQRVQGVTGDSQAIKVNNVLYKGVKNTSITLEKSTDCVINQEGQNIFVDGKVHFSK
ncbi:hypothetical protein AKO1_005435 [Acrasis kona]|uniref:Uncharacterized protein n=1 Tax=Acrasis kona TaxID=1008807 RepID=A0AAW2ZLP7_9EUKA